MNARRRPVNIAASVRARLLNLTGERGEESQLDAGVGVGSAVTVYDVSVLPAPGPRR